MVAVLPLTAGCASHDRFAASFRKAQEPAPLYHYGQTGGADSAGMHNVQSGDTLWSISQRYALSLQDIVRVNGLFPPYTLRDGQRLVLPPPATYRARAGDSLYAVSRTFNVSPSELARQNGLSAPYAIADGQVLRLPAPRAAVPEPVAVADSGGWRAGGRPDEIVTEPLPPSGGGMAVADRGGATAPGGAAAPVASSSGRAASGGAEATVSGTTVSGGATVGERAVPVDRMPPRAGTRFAWPVNGPVISGYGPKSGGLHNDGMNIRAARGAPVAAAENGVVVYAGNQLRGFGNLILIRHEDRWVTAYAHLQTIGVQRGQEVRLGDTIGTVGATGSVSEPQLHFEIRRGTEALNPALYLARREG